MRKDVALLLWLVLLTMTRFDLAFTVIALPLFAASSRRIHSDIEQRMNAFENKFVVANNVPYVNMDVTADGRIVPAACIADDDDPVCKQDYEKLCVNSDRYLNLVKANLLTAADEIFTRMQKECANILSDKEIKENIANYLLFFKAREEMGYRIDFNKMKAEAEFAKSKVIAEYQPKASLRLQTLIKLYRVVKLTKEKRLIACAEMAGLAYLELLKYQRETQDFFNIHWIRIRALRKEGVPFSHVFLIINAPDDLAEGDYQTEGSSKKFKWISRKDKVKFSHFKDMYVFDPYYKWFSAITDKQAKSLHKGLYTTHFIAEKMLNYKDIEDTQSESYNEFSGVFAKYWTEINEIHAELISAPEPKYKDREL